MKPHGTRSTRIALVIGIVVAWPPVGRGQAEGEAELARVREEIEAVQTRLAEQLSARDDGLAELKRVELAVAGAERELAGIADRSAAQERRQASLAEERRAASSRLEAERDALAQQVRMSYMTGGREEVLRLLLSQESPADLGRMLTYYDYLNRARSRRIEGVDAELATIARLSAESRDAERELERLHDAEAHELESLDRSRRARQSFLSELDASIAESGEEIERLRAEESRLNDLVNELATLMARLPTDDEAPFEDLKGKLSWPVEGRISADFGELREGGPLKWNGVVLEADAGTFVRAIYHGRVAFADWLPGLGLLLIIDHGGGFMSLYGHNEALLREPGAWVKPGEVIARVGDTGGQSAASLYFEIRQDGEPLNPHDWVP